MANVATAVVELLAEADVRYVFGVPSGQWVPFMEAMRTGPWQFVLTSTEKVFPVLVRRCSRLPIPRQATILVSLP